MELGIEQLGAALLALAAILTFIYKILMANKTSDVRRVVTEEVENHLSRYVDTLNKLVENDVDKRMDINNLWSKHESIETQLKRLYQEHTKLADNLYSKLDTINTNLLDLTRNTRHHDDEHK